MNNFYKQVNTNIHNPNISFQGLPSDIAKAKHFYEDFVDQMNKSDFCNTPHRYIAEIVYVRKLRDLYQQHNQQDLLKEMVDREQEILEKLKKEFGMIYHG